MGQTLILHIQKGSLSFKKKTPLWEGVKGGRGGSLSTPNLFGGGFFSPIQVFSRVRVSLRGSSPPKIIWEGGPLEVFCRGMTLKGEEGGVPQERRGEIPFSLSLSSEVPFLPITMDELRVPFLSSLNLVPVRQRSGREERGGFSKTPPPFLPSFFCPRGGPDLSLLTVSFHGTQQKREDPHFLLEGESTLSLSQGESMEDLFILLSQRKTQPLSSQFGDRQRLSIS